MTEKLDMITPDGVSQNIERIAALFPHCVTETIIERNGIAERSRSIDFDLLRQELSRDIVEGPKERYRLEWPGKREAIVTANMPTTNTLRPVREDSVNFDTTENLYIEGDNLEVLKLLQESYLGKVKMIYIDPPYNTGNDFVYRDNFAQDTESFKADSGLTDELGNRLVANPETAGRYHSDWLTMMYPRLKLARNLLTDDGVIFISIDDNEVQNLRKICDEVFGESNFVELIIWKKRSTPPNDKIIGANHDYILIFCKDINMLSLNLRARTEEQISRYKNPDNHIKGSWTSGDLMANVKGGRYVESLYFPIKNPNTGELHYPSSNGNWRFNQQKISELFANDEIYFGEDGKGRPKLKRFLCEVKDGITYPTIWDFVPLNTEGSKEMTSILGNQTIFDNPKPSGLILEILKLGSYKDSIILDFFSGSATTAHAVMQLNAEDGWNRKFIMVQLPEKTDEKSEAYKAGYTNICEIGKERIRRAGKQLTPQPLEGGEQRNLFADASDGVTRGHPVTEKGVDIGFRVYRLDTSNMQDVYYRPQDYKQEMMTELFANHIKPDRTADDLVAQIMLDWGLPLSLPIEQTTIAGKTVYKVDGNALYCCFDEGIDEGFVKEMVKKSSDSLTSSETITKNLPLRIIFHDYAFANDTAKENVRQLFKQLSPDTEMRVV